MVNRPSNFSAFFYGDVTSDRRQVVTVTPMVVEGCIISKCQLLSNICLFCIHTAHYHWTSWRRGLSAALSVNRHKFQGYLLFLFLSFRTTRMWRKPTYGLQAKRKLKAMGGGTSVRGGGAGLTFAASIYGYSGAGRWGLKCKNVEGI